MFFFFEFYRFLELLELLLKGGGFCGGFSELLLERGDDCGGVWVDGCRNAVGARREEGCSKTKRRVIFGNAKVHSVYIL